MAEVNNKKSKKAKVLKYTFGSLATGVVVIAPIATIFAEKSNAKTLNKTVVGNYDDNPGANLSASQTVAPKIKIATTINQYDFDFKGDNGSTGSAVVSPNKAGMENLDVYYSRNLASNQWTTTPLTGLFNGDIFYARLAVKDSAKDTYAIDNNVIAVTVERLTSSVPNIAYPLASGVDLNPSWFSFFGYEGSGSVYMNNDGWAKLVPIYDQDAADSASNKTYSPGIDYRLELQFSRGNSNIWQPYLYNLKNNETISARIGVKSQYADHYSVRPGTATIKVSGLPTAAPKNQQLDFNSINFSGNDGNGYVGYAGYNSKDAVKYSRTSAFISAFSDQFLVLDKLNNIYAKDGYQYKYLPPLQPIGNEAFVDRIRLADPIIRTFEPFIRQRSSVIKQASFLYNVYDSGKEYPHASNSLYINRPFSDYIAKITKNTNYWKIDLAFNDDGSLSSATRTQTDAKGVVFPKAAAEPLLFKGFNDGVLIDSGIPTGHVTIDRSYGKQLYDNPDNEAYIFVDKSGNIATAMDVRDLYGYLDIRGTDVREEDDNGMAIGTVIKNISYADGSVWSEQKVDNLVNGDFVSVYTTGASASDPKSDLATKGFAAQARNLQANVLRLAPVDQSYYYFTKGTGDMFPIDSQVADKHFQYVDILYSKDGINFSSKLPTDLSDNDIVFVQESVKKSGPAVTDNVVISNPNIIRIQAKDIGLVTLDDTISPEDFEYKGIPNSASPKLKDGKTLSSALELQYASNENGPYSNIVPDRLKNGDRLFVKLALNADAGSKYTFANADAKPTPLTVSGLDKVLYQQDPNPDLWTFSGEAGKGTVILNSGFTIPEAIEVLYTTTNNVATATPTVPTTLKNGDVVYFSFRIRQGYADNYGFLDDGTNGANNFQSKTVTGLSHALLKDTITKDDFVFSGTPGNVSASLKSGKVLPGALQVVYALSDKDAFGAFPFALNNGDKVYAKLTIKNEAQYLDNYDLAPASISPVELTVGKLTKITLTDKLTASDFDVTGVHESGTIALKSSKNLSGQLEVQYSTTSNGTYDKVAPMNLKNGDTIYAKLVQTSGFDNYTFGGANDKPLAISINTLNPKPVSDLLSANDFEFRGYNKRATIVRKTTAPALSSHFEVQYALSESGPYNIAAPVNLKNNDTVYIKLVQIGDLKNYSYSGASDKPLGIVVSGLNLEEVTDVITPEQFTFYGIDKQATVLRNKNAPALSNMVDIQYAVGASGAYSVVAPTNLKNNDKVYIKLLLKPGVDAESYKLSSASLAVVIKPVAGLGPKIILPDYPSVVDWAFEGTSGSGKIVPSTYYRPISEQVEILFSKAPNRYPDNPVPYTNLKNGETVYIGYQIKPEYANKYDLSEQAKSIFSSTSQFVNGLKKLTLSDSISSSDFVYTGQTGIGSVKISDKKALAGQLEILYSSTKDGQYGAAPTNLANNDKLYAKLSLKNDSLTTLNYDLAPASMSPVELTVTGLPKQVFSDKIAIGDFDVHDNNGIGTIALNPTKTLAGQLEVQYSVNGGAYVNVAPSTLKNNDKVTIKLVQVRDLDKFSFANANATPVQITIHGLGAKLINDQIFASDFEFKGTALQGWVQRKSDALALSEYTEVLYAKDKDGTYGVTPTDLKNNDTVYAKLSIKDAYKDSYVLQARANDPVILTVSGLTKISLDDKVEVKDFTFSGVQESGTLTLNKKLSPQVLVQYTLPYGQYSATVPNYLRNGNQVYVTLALKSGEEANYTLSNGYPKYTLLNVSGLTPKVVNDGLGAKNFTFNGSLGTPFVIYNLSLTYGTEIRYAKTIDGTYGALPTDIKNGDSLYAKLFIQTGGEQSLMLGEDALKPVSLSVSGLNKNLISQSAQIQDFTFSGINESGTVTLDAKAIQPQVEVLYAKNATDTFSAATPTDLKNSDVIYYKFNVKSAYQNNYTLDDASIKPMPLTVAGLNKKVLRDVVTKNDFEFFGNEGSGSVTVNTGNDIFTLVEATYATDQNGTYGLAPTNLKDGDKVYAKLKVQSGQVDNYELGGSLNNPIELTAFDLGKMTLPDSISANDFSFSGESENGKANYIGTNFKSSQVEIQYATSKNGSYSASLPDGIKNGDVIYAKLALKDGESATYKLGPNVGNPVVLKVTGLTKKVLPDTIFPYEFSFKGSALNGSIALDKALSPSLELQYATSPNGEYSSQLPSNIKNGDSVWVKAIVKSDDQANYELPVDAAGPSEIKVVGLAKIKLVDAIDPNAFTINKNSVTGKVSVIVDKQPEAALTYEFGLSNADGQVSWSGDVPAEVDDKPISVRLVPKDKANYEMASAEKSSTTLNSPSPEKGDASSNPSAGIIAGAVVGSLAGLGVLGGGGYYLFKKFFKRRIK